MQKRLLIIEDEQVLRVGIERFLSRHGYQVAMAADGGSALRMLETADYDMVLADLRLPDIDGTLLTRHIRSIAPSTLIMIMSAEGNLQEVLSLLRAGVYDFLAKPFLLSLLEQRIRYALNAGFRLHKLIGLRSEFQRQEPAESWLLGRGERIKALLGEMQWAALGLRPVLITGEAGTGKQQVAQLLYRWSGRPESDLHTWDAAQIGSVDTTRRLQTFLSDQTREARVELTPPSTLLLENLQLLSPEMRDRLYRFIARASRRQPVNGPWQMIATAQQASKGAVGLKALLEQLQFPNESFVFQLPPLREHMEDLPSIVDLLITQLRQRHAKPVFGVDTQAMRCLQAHTWPDNIRELRQVIEHAVMRCETLYIGKPDLPGYLQHGRPVSADTTRLH